MGNVVKIKSKGLDQIATRINELYSSMNVSYMETCQLFGRALEEEFKDDKPAFFEWAQETTEYSKGQINKLLRIQARFGQHRAAQQSEKPIPINVLETLARDNIPHRVVDRVIKMYQRKTTSGPSEREAIEIIRDSVPSAVPPSFSYNKPMENRIPKDGYTARAEYLLDVTEVTSAETIKIIANYWKNKFHPDKGGDARVFNLIVKAEEKLLKKRGVK